MRKILQLSLFFESTDSANVNPSTSGHLQQTDDLSSKISLSKQWEESYNPIDCYERYKTEFTNFYLVNNGQHLKLNPLMGEAFSVESNQSFHKKKFKK